MIVKPPQFLRANENKDPLAAALEQEIFGEKASTLSRLTKKLEKALEKLKETGGGSALPEEDHRRILAEAGEALWNVTIQRELCGLRRHKEFYDFLGVPKDVRLRMGPASLVKDLPLAR